MRRIELPLPELGRGTQFLDAKAEELQERLRKAVPSASRPFVVVKAFKRRGSSGLAVEYDDAIERQVLAVLEGSKDP